MTTWDPGQYLRFREARLRPALDLLARIQPAGPPGFVVDLGCGPGNLTALLAERWPDAEVVGVDSSPEMLCDARRDHRGITWVESDLAGYEPPRAADVVFTNAALHWLPDHATLLSALLARVAPGGVLAEYAAAMRSAHPPRPDGRTVMPFRRLFLVARALS